MLRVSLSLFKNVKMGFHHAGHCDRLIHHHASVQQARCKIVFKIHHIHHNIFTFFQNILARLLRLRTPKEKGPLPGRGDSGSLQPQKGLPGSHCFTPAVELYRTGNPVVRGCQKGGSPIGITSGTKDHAIQKGYVFAILVEWQVPPYRK